MFEKLSTALVLVCAVFVNIASAEEAPSQESLVGGIFAQEEARLAVMAVDVACSDRAQEIGFGPALVECSLEEVVYLTGGAQPIIGRDAMGAALGGDDGSRVVWAPEDAYMSASMDLGVTWGRYVFKWTGEDGKPMEAYGKYTTVWKKDAEGNWKMVLDTGNGNPKPE